jgi:hypothetical protein
MRLRVGDCNSSTVANSAERTRNAKSKQEVTQKSDDFPKRKEKKRKELVLGRFWESIRKDSIRLGIFAGEREDSIQKSKNRFRIGHDYFAKIVKTRLNLRVLAFV